MFFNFNKPLSEADQKEYTVPYEKKPDNCGIAFILPENSAILIYLDFEYCKINLIELEDFKQQPEYYGYTCDYTVIADYNFIEGIVDRLGGIDLELNGNVMRYTGTQIVELISTGKINEVKRQLILQMFSQIKKNNFSKDDFVYIIENGKSDLPIIDCIYWLEYLGDMSSNTSFVN